MKGSLEGSRQSLSAPGERTGTGAGSAKRARKLCACVALLTLLAACGSAPSKTSTQTYDRPAFPVPPPEVIDDIEQLTERGGSNATARQWERWWIDLERHATRLHGEP